MPRDSVVVPAAAATVVLLDDALGQVDIVIDPHHAALVGLDDEREVVLPADALEDIPHAIEDALGEARLLRRQLLLVLHVLRLKLDESLLVLLHALLERLAAEHGLLLLDVLGHALELGLSLVEGLLAVPEEALQAALGAASVVCLVQRTLKVDDRDANLRFDVRRDGGDEERGGEGKGESLEVHSRS